MTLEEKVIENWRFRRYFPEYKKENKTLYLKGKVPVEILMEIKYLRLIYNLEIENIMINSKKVQF